MKEEPTEKWKVMMQEFSSKFYYPIQQKKLKYEHIYDWISQKLQEVQSAYKAGEESGVNKVKQEIPDICYDCFNGYTHTSSRDYHDYVVKTPNELQEAMRRLNSVH